MRSLRSAVVLAGAISLALVAQSGAAGPTKFGKVFTVGSLTVPGIDTGIVLTGGQVTVTATGSVCPNVGFCVGPDGYAYDTTQSSFGGFVLPGAPAWGLVGRVGDGPWMQVGSGPAALSGAGSLVFAVNDDLFGDNSGTFTVRVSCYPGWGYGDKNHAHCGPPGLANKPSTPGQSSSDTHGKSGEHSAPPTSAGSEAKGNRHRP